MLEIILFYLEIFIVIFSFGQIACLFRQKRLKRVARILGVRAVVGAADVCTAHLIFLISFADRKAFSGGARVSLLDAGEAIIVVSVSHLEQCGYVDGQDHGAVRTDEELTLPLDVVQASELFLTFILFSEACLFDFELLLILPAFDLLVEGTAHQQTVG